MAGSFSFRLIATDGAARTGEITTAHGIVRTPAFMPVGTQGAIKGVHHDEVRAAGADIILANIYHLMLRPTAERVAALGGLHEFMHWPLPILTDSGGYQVMSLAPLRKVAEAGVTFRSHLDGAMVELTPERAVEVQILLGADIAMQLDECVRLPAEPSDIERAMRLSLRWAERCKRAFEKAPAGRALFGIVQGGDDDRLREESARALIEIGFDGYAIGGLAVGESEEVMLRMVAATAPALPAERPRYLMGVGTPSDILNAIGRGIDMFDCVLPTRNGRHGLAFTRFGSINLKNARHADDPRPLDPQSRCAAARDFSRAYLHHLFKANEALGGMLLSIVNLFYYQDLTAGARAVIAQHRFADYRAEIEQQWAAKRDLE
ncbi:MAG TPA: tRNA guanosine(34) transglycosylase Tgt [Xanthobacteraceae bacterium]|jgi:queuine tRNA-ribosyltransferase|nr:tRNA guanosine(34) transglycosylase Tgt [Xanthobacteraceae bacterium]